MIKTKIVLGLATVLTLAGALVMPPAIAQTKAERAISAATKKTAALEAQVNQMAAMMQSMQAELSRVKASAESGNSAKVQELDEWMAAVKSAPVASNKDHMIFFRGGYARNDHGRKSNILTDANAQNKGSGAKNILNSGLNTSNFTRNKPNGDREAWYFGAGFEFNLTNDLFGLWDGTSLNGEVTLNYKEFDSENLRRAPLPTAANDSASGALGVHSGGAVVCSGLGLKGGLTSKGVGPYGKCNQNVTVTQITLTAAPKIKFMEGSKFRPWIIPAGFGLHVISPPSDGVTVTAPGMLFGAGADYNIWKNIYVGIDGRYHLISNTVANVDLDGFEVGGYVGFGF